eukprot:6041603-Pleurochrysis_carterae.AAC.4
MDGWMRCSLLQAVSLCEHRHTHTHTYKICVVDWSGWGIPGCNSTQTHAWDACARTMYLLTVAVSRKKEKAKSECIAIGQSKQVATANLFTHVIYPVRQCEQNQGFDFSVTYGKVGIKHDMRNGCAEKLNASELEWHTQHARAYR